MRLPSVRAPFSKTLDAVAKATGHRFTLEVEHAVGGELYARKLRLANGLTVLMIHDPHAPVFAYQTWYGVGSRHERSGKTGIAHLFEHLMFKATETMPEGTLDRLMERRGAQTNAATWCDWTYYYQVLPASRQNLELVARVEADRMRHLVLNEAQLESERDVVKNERRYRVDDDPDGRAGEALYALALGREHPYGWPTIGWMEDIEAITLADCMAFYRTFYSPGNAVIVVVGSVADKHVLTSIARHYGHIAREELPSESAPPQPCIDGRPEESLTLPIAAERVLTAWVGPSLADPDAVALEVALEVLFGGESGRIQRLLVNELELCTQVGASSTPFRYEGLIELSLSTKVGVRGEQAEAPALAALAEFAAAGPSTQELEKARNQVEAGYYRSLGTANALASKLGVYEATLGDFREHDRLVREVRDVTTESARAVVERWMTRPGRATIRVRASDVAA